jgi:putative hydrolase of the HAD superfamily
MKTAGSPTRPALELVLFDFGGVIAEEGFREGLCAIARDNGLEPEAFYCQAAELIQSSGYLTGRASEQAFWQEVRTRCKISGSDKALRAEILSRFRVREWMLAVATRIRQAGLRIALLSDQTNWLDELEAALHFFRYFDQVFNSFHLHKSKHDPTIFTEVLSGMGIDPRRALFIDDTAGHLERARQQGLQTILYQDRLTFEQSLRRALPFLREGGPDSPG